MVQAAQIHEAVTGKPPAGWYTGRCSMQTVDLAAELGCRYIADSYADDLPYWLDTDGTEKLIVPYTLDANDMRFAPPQGFNAGDQFEAYLRDSFDCLYAEGLTGAPKMMSIGLHCRLVGRPGRVMALQRFFDYARGHEGVWFATREQIADHWSSTHPFERRLRPSTLDHARFMDHFGGIFEHSPWVAEAAYGGALGPAHDTAPGLHSAMVRAFRAGTPDQKMQVLKAHPDLAGKLAAAKRLTAESTTEQASAGLDALTDDERATFTELNARYVDRYGFPFIIAAKDNTKSSILAAFQTRIDNSADAEFITALRQVDRIAWHRLHDILPFPPDLA